MFSLIPQGPFYSFLWLSDILLYTYKYKIFILYKHIYKTSPLSIHQLIDICSHILVCVCVFSCVWLCATLWTITRWLLCPWDSPGKNTGMGCHFLLQGMFLTQGSNSPLLHLLPCRQILYPWAIGETQIFWLVYYKYGTVNLEVPFWISVFIFFR